MVRIGLVIDSAGCGGEGDIFAYVTIQARISPGQSAEEAAVIMFASLQVRGDDGSVVAYCGPADVRVGDVALARQQDGGICEGFSGAQTGYRTAYPIDVHAAGDVIAIDAVGPAVHAISFEPAEPTIDVPATVRWEPNGEPDVRAFGWYWTSSNSAESVRMGNDIDDGIGVFSFPARGDRIFGVQRFRQSYDPITDLSTDIFLTVENDVRVR